MPGWTIVLLGRTYHETAKNRVYAKRQVARKFQAEFSDYRIPVAGLISMVTSCNKDRVDDKRVKYPPKGVKVEATQTE